MLEFAKENLEACYDQSDRSLINLQIGRMHQRKRQLLSEQREAIALVFGAILHCTDLVNLQVGYWQSKTGKIVAIDIRRLAAYATVHEKRCRRVLNLLRDNAYLKISFDMSSTMHVRPCLFYHLGGGGLLNYTRRNMMRASVWKKE